MSEKENSVVQSISGDETKVSNTVQSIGNESKSESAKVEMLSHHEASGNTKAHDDENSSGCTPKTQNHELPGETEVSESSSKKNRRKKREKISRPVPEGLPNTNEALVPQFNIDRLNEVFNVLRLVVPEIQEAKECIDQNGASEMHIHHKRDKKKNKKKQKGVVVSVEKQGSLEQTADCQPEDFAPEDNAVGPPEKSKKEKRKKKSKKQVNSTLECAGKMGAENRPRMFLQEQEDCTLESREGDVRDKKKPKVKPKRIVRSSEGETEKSSAPTKTSPTYKKRKNNSDKPFEDHWPLDRLLEGLEKGELIEGIIRINPKQFKDAYVSIESKQDLLIEGILNRNRALEGDVVVLLVNDSSEWKDKGKNVEKKLETKEKESEDEIVDEGTITDSKQISDREEVLDEGEILPGQLQQTAKVVGILSAEHSRKCVGYLKLMKDKSDQMALFCPRDSRVPRLRIYRRHTPPDFWKDPAKKSKTLYLAKITKWSHVMFAVGEIIGVVGESDSLGAETSALLLENDIDTSPYPASFSEYFPGSSFLVNSEEIAKRTDLRKECIFTIDPATAKDLDDAVSCKELENGNFEIGVHISDVTYFLQENTPLDKAVAKRATSVYLVEKVYHMLPLELCLLCSLSPGTDKLAYSVVWEITKDAKIVSQRIFRSVINSCAKLAYEHALAMIENPDREWKPNELPSVYNGFKVADLNCTVNNLQRIAVQLRRNRFKDGALRIDQTKIGIHLDPEGMPIAFQELVTTESNRLIEEFMLLANMTVAKFIFDKSPEVAFLRCHPEPKSYLLEQLKEFLEALGIHLDISSAGALQASLERYQGDDFLSTARTMVLNLLCAKTMNRAKYFCSSLCHKAEFWHYALNVPFYTHFTSPIRRYADIMVHRLLNAALGYSPKPNWTANFVQKIAANCNKQKFSAKLAGEQSIKLYLSIYVSHHQPLLEQAVVTDVKDHSFDVTVLRFGFAARVYVNKLDNVDTVFTMNDKFPSLTVMWKPSQHFPYQTSQVIHVFTIVHVNIDCADDSLKMKASLVHPSSVDSIAPS